MTHEPRILLLDIETLPNVVLSWGLWVDGPISHDNLLDERTILCAAWKWLGKREVESAVAAKGDDKALVKRLCEVIASADAVVTHNGDKFDLPWVKTRAVYHGIKPSQPTISIDTRKIAKRFYFNNNRLDYLGQFLRVGKKIKTDFGLWLKCREGDKAAIAKMVRYNKEDVRLLERVYLKLRPYVPAKFNHALSDANDRTCPTCGKEALESRGYGCNRASRYVRFQCRDCGAWSSRPCGSRVVR